MALTFLGVDEFKITGPPQWRPSLWDLDTLIVPYSGPIAAMDDFIAELVKGTAYEEDENMFLVDYPIQNAHKQYPAVDLIYSGKRNGTLPSTRNEIDTAVQSASSATDSSIFPLVNPQAVTVQYYAPTTSITVLSRTSTSTVVCPEPAEVTSLITWAINVEQPGSSFPEISAWILENAFVQRTIDTTKAEELVPGKYWKIVKRKTRVLFPYAPEPGSS